VLDRCLIAEPDKAASPPARKMTLAEHQVRQLLGTIRARQLRDGIVHAPRHFLPISDRGVRLGLRVAALTPEVAASPLARTPYDLRHAAVSTWLNAGVPPTNAAEWAGHSVEVLLKIYAKCLDGRRAGCVQGSWRHWDRKTNFDAYLS
jgi:integrase